MNPNSKSHDQMTPSLKSQKKPRGKINTVACDRCKRDKKKCDGNYLTGKTCKYCHNHNETCVYSEPNFLRISRILNAAAKKNAEREDDSEKSIQELITRYENTIISLMSQIENKNETKTIDIGNLYLSLFSNPQITSEQTIILKKLCEMTNNTNSNIDNENLNKIINKLLILTSNDSTELDKSQSWNELENFVINNNLIDNIIPLAATNFFGFSYPSGSTTPIPSPQFLNNDQFEQFQSNDYKPNATNNHMTTSKKRKIEHIAIRPSKKDNVLVWHQNDPCEDVPVIAVHAPQNNHSIVNETTQSPIISFGNIDNISSNGNLQFPTLLSQESYEVGLDEIEQFSNITSPTFSSNSFSDDNMEFPTYLPNPPVDLLFFPNSTNFNENF